MAYFKKFFLILTLASCPVMAQEASNPLHQVLELTYSNNPTIQAAREEFLAVKEGVSQARGGYLPNVSVDADVTYADTETEGSSFITSEGGNTSSTASLNVSQPLFKGGSTRANVNQAENVIAAQQFSLSAIEQQTLYDAVIAYMDVYRDKAILSLQENNKALISKELDQATVRFKVGEITRTDVSQSESRLAQAEAEFINARAAFNTARARFKQIVGNEPPTNIGYPLVQFDMPTTLDEALALAETNNRDIIQAHFTKQAAASEVESIKGELLPQLDAVGRLNKTYTPTDFIDEQRQASVGLTVSMPLYAGGVVKSRIRQAKKVERQRAEQINIAKKSVEQQVIRNWEDWDAAKAETKARLSQVNAAIIAQEGVGYEAEFGERTTLDVLDANQELLSAQVDLVTSKRNEVVAKFAVAQSLGLLVPQNLGFSTINP